MAQTPPRKFSVSSQALHVEHLMIQREHLLLVRDRHLQWMGDAQSPALRHLYYEIAELLSELDFQYELLIQALEGQEAQKEQST